MGTHSGYQSCTISLLLLTISLWSIHAELTFLGQEPNRAFIPQTIQERGTVYQFFVVDTSSSEMPTGVTFTSSLNNLLPFLLDPLTGELVMNGLIMQEEYFIIVQATLSDITIVTNITIFVVPISDADTSPRFEHELYEIEISENLPQSSPFIATRAFSLTPNPSTQQYSIVAGNTDNDFSINSGNGLLRVNEILDRERTSAYQLTIRYVDDLAFVDASVAVSIRDVNDQAPQFSRSLYNVTVAETLSPGSVILTVDATDNDVGINAMVTYSFDATASEAFSLNQTDGVLRAISELDYERQPRYQFSVTVQDSGSPRLTSVTTVLVNLQNIDDECPRFENGVFIEELPYDIAGTPPGVGTEILTVMATDPDRFSDVTYSIISGSTPVLALDTVTGVITLASIDDDPRGQYTLNVSASDQSCINQSFVRVEIGIGNVNDHSPQFQSDCTATLEENPTIGMEVTTLLATDDDIGFNGLITYSLLSGTELFEIDASGVVRTTAPPEMYDREVQTTLLAGVTATDGGGRQDYCLLTITLIDQNDNAPRIPLPSYSTSLARDSGIGTFVLQITAEDPDLGNSGRIEYSINSEMASLPFEINSMNGVITTSNTFLSSGTFTFDVVAADMDPDEPLTSTTMVTITLTENGDALPRFSALNYTGEICENSPVRTVVLTVNASSTSPIDFIFRILAGSDYRSNDEGTFEIRTNDLTPNLATIVVGSQSIVNFELLSPHRSFQFFVEASTGSGRSIVPVEIFIIDVDDNVPSFPTQAMSIVIAENEPIGTTVAQLQAVDLDSGTNGEIQYRFRNEEASPYFAVTMDGFISSLQVFDFEAALETSGMLIVEAYNPNPIPTDSVCSSIQSERASSFTRIEWSILDQNDNPPAFTTNVFTVSIREDASIQTRILELNATDMDISDLGRLTFSINSGNDGTFSVESQYIILTRRLDFETTQNYELIVHVTDGIHSIQDCPQSSCIAMVIISVLNVDDEPPVFSELSYEMTVVENAPIGTEILNISATDVDSSSIEYRLTGLAEGRFQISEQGIITVAGEIDREAFPNGGLVFLAFAEGGSLATADIVIDIQDVNDYAPRFSGVFTGEIVENTPSDDENGIAVTQVRAVDLDAGENGTILYSLVGEKHGFEINPETGVITAHAVYDREATPNFVLTVQATDNGTSVQLSSRTEVVITIGDVNDNSARFQFPYMYARVFENAQIGQSVLFLPVIDPDTDTNAEVVFTLLATTPQESKFALNPMTGEITITGILDYEIPQHRLYTLTVSVQDPANPPSSEGTVQIELLDRNDNEPEIDIDCEKSLLQETFPTGVEVATVTGSDEDSGENAQLTFEITNGNTNEDFILLMDGGRAVISSAHQFDYETTFSYALTITVSDMGSPSLSSTAVCEFTIIDVNDEPPIFTESEYRVSIVENSPPEADLLQIKANDTDTADGGQIARYELISGNEGGWFALNASGFLSSLVTFDREERAEYTLIVAAYDNGAVPIRGTASVVITIEDVNDNPSFDGGHLNVLISALNGQVPVGNIAPLNFNDPDTDDMFSGCNIIRQDHADIFNVIRSNCMIELLINNPPEDDYNYVEVDGRDGMNTDVSVTATIRVVHFDYNESTSPVAQNLVTLTLNASSEEYIREKLNITLPVQIARALGVAERNVEIITVQRGVFSPASTVDVSFVARSSTDHFVAPATILHQLYLRRESLQLAINGHEILSLPLDMCVSEPCQNQAGCRTIQNVQSTEKVISTREFVYFAPRIEFTYECLCVPGTSGQHCETNFDDCYSNPCQQGAACTDLVNGFSCDCPDGYTGVGCSIAPDTCSTNVCSNEAACTIVNDDIHCDCNPGYYGPRCQYQYFVPSSLCENSPCQNGGDCSAGRDAISCICLPGFSGQFCEIETQVQGGCVGNPCYNGSTCEETPRGPDCTCSVGFTGPSCRWPLNNCELEPCLNGGTCATGLYGTHMCSCQSGYTGDDCATLISPCFSNPCLNNGSCTADNDNFTCECISGYYGTLCEFTVEPVDFCSIIMECSENGNCTSGRDTLTCSCEDGFTGDDCSIFTDTDDVCMSNPCQHGSTCTVETEEDFACFCSPGFTGTNCEININDCLNNMCINGGICIDGINGHSCTCQPGFAGYNCEVQCPQGLTGVLCRTPILSCLDMICANSGTCIQNGGMISCECPPTHTGSRCEIELECTQNTCLNGGSCVNLPTGGIECTCTEEFTGDNCELLTVSFSGSASRSSYRAFESLDIRGQGRIEFEFATVDKQGLLLYNTQLQNGQAGDYIAVEIVSGALQVSVSHGSGDSSVTFLSSPQGVADGNWHQVIVEANQKEFHVLLDDCLLLPTSLLPFATCSLINITPGRRGFLDLGLPLWLGGAPLAASSAGHFASQGITGCIRGVKIDGQVLDLKGYLFEANSARGCSHLEACAGESPSVCGGGNCISVFDGSSCNCPARREGAECETAAQSIVYGGGSFAQYSILEYLSTTKRQASTDSLRSSISDDVSLWFRTEMGHGLTILLYMGSTDTGDEFYLQVEAGVLSLVINLGSVEETFLLTNNTVADSAWHFVAVTRSALELTTTVDDVILHHTLKGTQLSLDVRPIIYTGGRPDSVGSVIIAPYLGCLQDIRIDNNPLPTSGANDFASIVFVGEEVSNNCALGLCLPNPCGRGNCSEITITSGRSFECACDNGLVVTGNSCPGDPTPPMFTLIVVFAIVAGGLLICVTIISMGMVCYQYRRRLASRIKSKVGDHADISLAILNRQALGVSNEAGGGERDTHIGIHEISNTLFANKHAIEDDEKEQSATQSSTDTSISKPSFSMLQQRAASPTIGEFIREKIEGIPKEYRDFDSLCEYEEEGNGSLAGSLSTICSSIAESEYTIEKLRAAGPELEPFIDLLADVLESEDEEEMYGDSQQAHTGNTPYTQGTLYSQELW